MREGGIQDIDELIDFTLTYWGVLLKMFDWGQIWTVRRPIEWVNVMIGEKILTNSGYMGPGVILREN
jgi:hypothetical protein